MTEHRVIWRDNQEVQAADFTNQGDSVENSLDHVVFDAIEYGNAYSGFSVTKAAPTQISIATGRLYQAGQVFVQENVQTIDLYNQLPVVQQKQIAVVVWASTIQENIQARDFIIDADTGQSQPQSVAMTTTRYANVGTVAGVEAAQPTLPPAGSTQVLVAYVLCNPTGILSIQQVLSTQIDSVQDLANRVSAIEAFDQQTAGAIAALQTALAGLAAKFQLYTLLSDFQKLVDLVNLIWKIINTPPGANYVWVGTDNFLDTSQSLVGGNVDGNYNALVQQGLRFPGTGAMTVTALQLLNPSDPNADVCGDPAGFLLPEESGSRIRLDCSFPTFDWIQDSLLQYTYWTWTLRHLHPSRHRHRCGLDFQPCQPMSVFQRAGNYDPIRSNLMKDSESWTAIPASVVATHLQEDDVDWPQLATNRWLYYWHDSCDKPYWAKVFDNFPYSGNHICQTFLNQQDGWLTGITLFSHNALAQPVSIIITYVNDDGTPDIMRGIRHRDLQATDMTACFGTPVTTGDLTVLTATIQTGIPIPGVPVSVTPCRINFDPVFLEAGKRYGIHVISTYDHHWSISNRDECFQIHQGHFWASSAQGLYLWPGVPSKHLRFLAHYAIWGQWGSTGQTQRGVTAGGGVRAELQMQPLSQAGGIHSVDILTDAIEPAGTIIAYNVQIGNVWYPFADDPTQPAFQSNPTLVPLKVVFNGTTDLMPAISLTQSQVELHAPLATSFHHIGTDLALGTTAVHVKLIAKVTGFVSAHHTLAASIHYGGLSPGTHKTADTVADTTCDDGSLQRTWTFNSVSLTEFYTELDGTTDGAVDPFVVAQLMRFQSTT
jgi:hypothetical protein